MQGQGSIKRCAEAIGIPHKTLRRYLVGHNRPNYEAKQRLSEYLGMPIEELFTEEVLKV